MKLYGPFTSVHALRSHYATARRLNFKFRTCHLDIREEDANRRILYAHACFIPFALIHPSVCRENFQGDLS